MRKCSSLENKMRIHNFFYTIVSGEGKKEEEKSTRIALFTP